MNPTTAPAVPVTARLGLEVTATPVGVEVAVDLDGRWDAGDTVCLPGVAALLCDAATGSAVAVADPSRSISTALLSLDITGVPRDGRLRAIATTDVARGDYVRATAVVRDGGGLEVARATSWWARRERRPAPPPGPAADRAAPRRAAADTGLGATPLGRWLGLVPAPVAPGDDVAFALADVGELRNRSGTLHGGVGALLAQLAAVRAVDDGVTRPDVLSFTCHYLRAAGTATTPVHVSGARVRRGRTSAVASGVVHAHDGRAAMLADVTVAFARPTDDERASR